MPRPPPIAANTATTTQLTPVFACNAVEAPHAKQLSAPRHCALLCVTASRRQRERGWLSARNAEWRGGKAQPLSNTRKAAQCRVRSACAALCSAAFHVLTKPVCLSDDTFCPVALTLPRPPAAGGPQDAVATRAVQSLNQSPGFNDIFNKSHSGRRSPSQMTVSY